MTLAFRDVASSVTPGAGAPAPTPSGDTGPHEVLVVSDDRAEREDLAVALALDGFSVTTAASTDRRPAHPSRRRPDLIVLDTAPGGPQALEAYRRISTVFPGIPVIVVDGSPDELDAVAALEAGAADHVGRPVRCRELTARVRAVLRRMPPPGHGGSPPVDDGDELRRAGPVVLDLAQHVVTVEGRPVELSRKEFSLLALLLEQPGHVVTRDECMARVWPGRTAQDSRTLDTHMKRLRRKLEADATAPRHLLTIRGIGYRFRT